MLDRTSVQAADRTLGRGEILPLKDHGGGFAPCSTAKHKQAPTDLFEGVEQSFPLPQTQAFGGTAVHGQKGELTAELRAKLKRKWTTESDPQPWVWCHTNGPGSARYGFTFDRSATITNLPAAVRELTSEAFSLHVVNSASLATLHQTSMGAFDGLAKQDLQSPLLQGTLNARDLRFSNRESEPAFYTTVDPHGGLLDLDGPDNTVPLNLLLQFELRNVRRTFVLDLSEPVALEEQKRFLARLSGDPHYLEKFRTCFEKTVDQHGGDAAAHNFDLFMNAVVRALRVVHGIPVDLLLYRKRWTSSAMGRPRTFQYLWPVIYDRSLLEDAKVTAAYDFRLLPFPFADSAALRPMPRRLYEVLKERPDVGTVIAGWAQSPRYTRLQCAWTEGAIPDWKEISIRRYLRHIQTTWLPGILSRAEAGESDRAIDLFIAEKVTQDILAKRKEGRS